MEMSPLFATEIADQNVGTFVIGVVVLGAIGVLSFLVKNAFEGTTKAVADLGVELKKLGADISRGDGDRRELAAEVRALTSRIDRLERDISEGVAR
jgi:hypothetical protein